ncbi:MAG TPA: hypothetical protein VJP80_03365 [Candidatus Saccharimonadales bacterium]|nr:hypothetical protein [Candidatus Saccharimonadales bacterium]
MEFPRDPLGGVVSFVGYSDSVPRQKAVDLVESMGAYLGIEVNVLPNETPEDNEVIDMLAGAPPDEHLWMELLPPDESTRRWFTDMPDYPIVFVARYTPDTPVPEAGPELADFAERLERLHETVRNFGSRA